MIAIIIALMTIVALSSFIGGYMTAAFEPHFSDRLFCTLLGVLTGLIALMVSGAVSRLIMYALGVIVDIIF